MKIPHTDIISHHPVYRLSPPVAWPYLSLMRLDRPIGTWLLLLPGWWSIAMEARGITHMTLHHLYLMVLFGFGAIIMRGAGCVINDLWDKDFDKAVERTRSRPLASGIISPRQAMFFLGALLFAGLVILLQLPQVAILLGIVSLAPVSLYPLAKRFTWYPQAILGLTFNFGALMGSAAVSNNIPASAILLYVAGFFWTLGYDTLYAHQDIADDSMIGIKSTARKFGDNSPTYISIFYSFTTFLLFVTGMITGAGILFFIVWALAGFHLVWQIASWKMHDPKDCLSKFRKNRDFGLLVFTAFLLI